MKTMAKCKVILYYLLQKDLVKDVSATDGNETWFSDDEGIGAKMEHATKLRRAVLLYDFEGMKFIRLCSVQYPLWHVPLKYIFHIFQPSSCQV